MTPVFIAVLFTLLRHGNSFSVCKQIMDKEAIVYIYVTQAYNGVLLTNKNEWYFAICSNTDGLGGHYARDKSDREW